uniref:40S ribosomal protein S10 n=1 Tax=Salisapilia bahamensis TaxID=758755 RepID=G4X6G8_9STRA|nr:40S ribosomal protein S10 [Salisapilia bahamensis]
MYILRITFKSIKKFDQIKESLTFFKTFRKFNNIKINGVFKTKKKKKIFTVLKSPHVNKKSREHFVYNNYIQKIDIEFKNFIQLLNFSILIKKIYTKHYKIDFKIIKKNKMLIA